MDGQSHQWSYLAHRLDVQGLSLRPEGEPDSSLQGQSCPSRRPMWGFRRALLERGDFCGRPELPGRSKGEPDRSLERPNCSLVAADWWLSPGGGVISEAFAVHLGALWMSLVGCFCLEVPEALHTCIKKSYV